MKILILNKYQNKVSRGAETLINEINKRLSNEFDIDVVPDVNYFKIIKNNYDLIIPTNGREQVVLIKLLSLFFKFKVIVIGMSGIGLDDRINLYLFPKIFIALSTKALKWAYKVNPFVKSIYIPAGVDLSKFKENQKIDNKDKKTILSVGAFTEQKRHELVIEAVVKLKDVKLIIAGGGGDKKLEIVDLAEKLLGKDRFEIVETTNDKMPAIYNKVNVFTLASRQSESFGIVLVEAMACGLPVVATDDPIRREIVGDAGLFVDPTDTDAYAKAIEKALNTDWGDKPRKQAEKFDWDKIAKQYEELFNSI